MQPYFDELAEKESEEDTQGKKDAGDQDKEEETPDEDACDQDKEESADAKEGNKDSKPKNA